MNWFWYCRECGEGMRMVALPNGLRITLRHVEGGLHELRLSGAVHQARPHHPVAPTS